MSQSLTSSELPDAAVAESVNSTPPYQAFQILRAGFVAAPILAGADKFFHVLTNWDMYLAPAIANLSPFGSHALMSVIGIVEIAAGVLVALKPRIGAYVVAGWLIVSTLITTPKQSFAGVALIILGLPVYYYLNNRSGAMSAEE